MGDNNSKQATRNSSSKTLKLSCYQIAKTSIENCTQIAYLRQIKERLNHHRGRIPNLWPTKLQLLPD
jgi:hypothetical protein